MVSQALKTAVVIFLASAVLPTVAVTGQAQDLTADAMMLASDGADTATGRYQQVAASEAINLPFSRYKSGAHKPPMPDTGISTLLITGVVMISIAVRRPTVAA